MSKLQLILLGQFECLLSSGQRISLSMRKAEVLLAYLALAPGIRHPRERLINLLWSDRGEEQARNSLRQCLSAIKKSLGDSADLILQVDRTTVSLKPGLIDVDALEFEQLATQGDFESLSTAAVLYRGEFLEGISIRDAASQDWLDGERARFKRQFVEILANLGETQLLSHDFSAAIRSTERLVEQDPLGESGWRLLMRSYADSGDRSHALQAFKRCEKSIRDELDVEPETATIELRAQIAGGNGKTVSAPERRTLADTPASTEAEAGQESVDPASSTDHSIAVLPLDNLSGDPEQEYFSDGITESIILNLSLFPGLNVKSRNSSFAFKQQIKSPGEISKELEVDYLVEGSIRKTDERVRVTIQLVEATSGNQVWGKRYDAEIENLFDLEEDLSRTIAATVTGQIESDLQRIAIAKGAAHQQSYDLLLQGIYHCKKNTASDMVIAIEKLQQCLELDASNALAHATLYSCHEMNWIDRWVADFEASRKLCKEHASKALALNPDLGEVQVVYAGYLIFNREFAEAEAHLNRALEINPNDSEAIAVLAINLSCQGKFEAALEQSRLALQLDPYHTWARWILSESLFFCGLYDEVLETIAATGNPPGFVQIYKIAANIRLGRMEIARDTLTSFLRHCRESMSSMPRTMDEWLAYSRDNAPFADPTINQEIVDYLVQAGLEDESGSKSARSQSDEHSIAVLPFDNLSGDAEQEYFSDGITDSIILNLSLFPGLQIKSRNSSFAFKQQIKSVGEISQELNVDYLVEGSIRKSGDRIRITVQLIETENGNQVWGKRYDAKIDDLFDLEEDLSRTIAATVTGQIESDLQRIAIARSAAHQDAYELLLSGIYHCHKVTATDTSIAIEKLDQCLGLDPDNVRAHTMLYTCHILNSVERWVLAPKASAELARKHIDIALSLAPENVSVLAAYAEYLVFSKNPGQALGYADKALQKNPNDPDAIAVKAFALQALGAHVEALEIAELAQRLDPYHPWVEWNLTECQICSGQYEQALDTIAHSNNDPGLLRLYSVVANIKLDRRAQARQALSDLLDKCRADMLSMPTTREEWLQFCLDYIPFEDSSFNEDVIDCLMQAGLEDNLSPTASPDLPDEHSIAVLPFDNLSGDAEQEYFSDGITDSIILNLSAFPRLNVKSRNASFAFKQQIKNLGEISQELKVDYLVEGSIRKSADQVRINVQLIEATSGNQVWGKRYDAVIENLFELEAELSRTIAATVTGQIESDLQRIAIAKGASNQTAYDLLLSGNYHCNKMTRADMTISIEKLNRCLELDPDNHRAWSGLYDCHMMNAVERWLPDHEASFKQAGICAQKALALAPDNTHALSSMAEFLTFSRKPQEALEHIKKALQLNPNDAIALCEKSFALGMMGQHPEALKYAELGFNLDPYFTWAAWNLSEAQILSGRYEEALHTAANAKHDPKLLDMYSIVAYVKLGRMEPARQTLKRYLENCRRNKVSMPKSRAEWLDYSKTHTPLLDTSMNEDIVECLMKAGLEEELTKIMHAGLCDQPEIEFDSMPSIAVLPFENMSGDPEQDHFSDGITTDIIATLSKFKHMRTVARYSVLQYRDQKTSIADIAEQQKVRYILEGSVRKSGEHIRVSAQLIDAQNDQVCWSERYDRDLDDLFAVQDEITRNIALAMKVQLDDGDKALHRSKGATSIKAWELTLAAVDLQETYIRQNILDARALANEAIRLDPDYAYAWITLGWSYWQEAYCGWSDSIEELIEEAIKANQHAMSLDPDYGEAWTQAGMNHQMKHEAEEAVAACLMAAEREPGSAEVHALTAYAYLANDDLEAARKHEQNMCNLCPIRPNWYYLVSGGIEKKSGHLDLAIKLFQQGLDVEPDSPVCRFYLIDALMEKGDEVRAQRLAEEIRALDKSMTGKGMVHANSYDAQERQRFHDNLAKFNLV